jgi:GntR family transcriptional repressor for pyruvate dehydrogenase complex
MVTLAMRRSRFLAFDGLRRGAARPHRDGGTLRAAPAAVATELPVAGRANLSDNLMIMAISATRDPAAGLRSSGGPLVAERLSDRLAARLAEQIAAGGNRPGDRLPTEAQLAATHGVSRTVVREAVHQLKSRGLLVSRQGSGVFVAAPPAHRALAFDPTVLDSVEAVVQVVEVRRVLEAEIAALAAERATRAQVARLRKALADIDRAAAAGGDGVAEDLGFHRAIADACGNPQFGRLLGFLGQYLHEAMRLTRSNEARRQDFMEQVRLEHRAIVDAIADGDAAAARRCATRHIRNGERRLERGGVISRRPAPRRAGS